MPEWPKGADCKSAGLCLRWFESTSLHNSETGASSSVSESMRWPSSTGTASGPSKVRSNESDARGDRTDRDRDRSSRKSARVAQLGGLEPFKPLVERLARP